MSDALKLNKSLCSNKIIMVYDYLTTDGDNINNIETYDYQGNYLYNIGDIVPNLMSVHL